MFASNHPEILRQYELVNKVVECDDFDFYVNFTFNSNSSVLIKNLKTIKDVEGKDKSDNGIVDFIYIGWNTQDVRRIIL